MSLRTRTAFHAATPSASPLSRLRSITVVVGAVLLAGPGCHGSDKKGEPVTARPKNTEASEPTPPPERVDRSSHRAKGGNAGRTFSSKGGPEMLFHAALENLELTEEQTKAIEDARRGTRENRRTDKPQAFKLMGRAVRKGTIDEKALLEEIGSSSSAAKDGRQRMIEGLKKLHETLTAEQRRSLVDVLVKKLDERPADDDRGQDEKAQEKRESRLLGPLDHMLRAVTMTEEQRTKIQAALAKEKLDQEAPKEKPDRAAFVAKRKAALEAFAKDTFDGDAVLPPDDDKGATEAQNERMVKALAIIVPMLDDGQRGELADRLEQGPRGDKQTKRGPKSR